MDVQVLIGSNVLSITKNVSFEIFATPVVYFLYCLDMLEIAERKLFMNGWPVKSVIALSSQQFKIVGELMVMSILQGGPAPNFLD
jgi:hypothetical protein